MYIKMMNKTNKLWIIFNRIFNKYMAQNRLKINYNL